MGLFGFSKKDNVLDLAERYKKQREREEVTKSSSNLTDEAAGEIADNLLSPEERRRKLAKRIVDMTNRLEDLSNQIYHLQQRLEVLERKLNVKIE